jgi:hypothetical protein
LRLEFLTTITTVRFSTILACDTTWTWVLDYSFRIISEVDRRILRGNCPSNQPVDMRIMELEKIVLTLGHECPSETRIDRHKIISCRNKDGDGIKIVLSRESWTNKV